MTTTANAKRTPEEFAANYPKIHQDGFFGPLTMGNIGVHNGRIIYNVNVKTAKSGDKGASFSTPEEWGQKFNPGDPVNVIVQDGYIKKALAARPQSITSSVNKAIKENIDEQAISSEELQAAAQEEATEKPMVAETAEGAAPAEKPF